MVRASLTPLAERQQFASLWLEDHFDKYGDHSPNSDEIHLHIMQRSELYGQYCDDQLKTNSDVVDYPRFLQLWSVLFPKCRSRPWCDIPGKCNVCYEIDRLRRSEEDRVVQEMLQKAHQMHRGGLFMLERNE